MDILNQIAIELKLNPVNVKKAVELLDQGDTVPFIARYRKEETGGLTDENRRDHRLFQTAAGGQYKACGEIGI